MPAPFKQHELGHGRRSTGLNSWPVRERGLPSQATSPKGPGRCCLHTKRETRCTEPRSSEQPRRAKGGKSPLLELWTSSSRWVFGQMHAKNAAPALAGYSPPPAVTGHSHLARRIPRMAACCAEP